jgi:hypothetical protein
MANDLVTTGQRVLAPVAKVLDVLDEIHDDLNRSMPVHGQNMSLAEQLAERALPHVQSMKAALAETMKPASPSETQNQLAVLVACFPNAPKDTPLEVYGAALRADVEDAQPSRGALALACRNLRRDSRFLPTISEVLDALEVAETRLRHAAYRLDDVPRIVERRRAEIERVKREHAQRVANCRRRLEDGKSIDHYTYTEDVVAEARAQMDEEQNDDTL